MQASWKTAVVQKLNENTSLRALVGNRIYPAYLADVTNPKFPCVNFAFEGGSRRVFYLSHAQKPLRFWAYSIDNFKEAQDVFDLVETTLNGEAVTSSEARMMFYLMTDSVEVPEDEKKGVTGAFLVRTL